MSLEIAKQILNHLRDCGLQCAIAGGCARDMFLGVEPKDVDIVVFGIADRDSALCAAAKAMSPTGDKLSAENYAYCAKLDDSELLRAASYSLLYDFRKPTHGFHVTDTFTIYHSKLGSGDQLVEGHKFDCGVDVLVYEPAKNLFEALQMFDYNLSQFALVGPEYTPEYLGMDSLTSLVKTRNDMDHVRQEYVKAKYETLKPLIDQAIAEGRLF